MDDKTKYLAQERNQLKEKQIQKMKQTISLIFTYIITVIEMKK